MQLKATTAHCSMLSLTYRKENLDLSASSLRRGTSTGRITTIDNIATTGGTIAHKKRKGPVYGAYTAV